MEQFIKPAPETVFRDLEEIERDVIGVLESVVGEGRFPDAHVTPEYIGRGATRRMYQETTRAVISRQVDLEELEYQEKSARVTIPTTLPVTIAHIGDVHYGAADTDHKRFDKDMKTIEDTDGMYVNFMGNLVENQIPAQYPDGLLRQVINPEEQIMAVRAKVQELDRKGKVIAAVGAPCHEGWSYVRAGQDVNRQLYDYDERGFPVLANGGEVEIKVGNRVYKEALYHRSGPFHSNLNKNNAMQRMRQLHHQDIDIIAGGHNHVAEAMITYAGMDGNEKPVAHLRTGTYKLGDKFARDRGYKGGEPSGEAVTLWPNKRRILVHLDIDEAAEVHEAIRLREMLRQSEALEPVKKIFSTR